HCRVPLVGTNGVLKPDIETAANKVKKQIEQKRLPAYVPPATASQLDYDGLIVRVPAKFTPNIYPKIWTNDSQLVYDMRSVPLPTQVNRGGIVQYADDVAKATSLLNGLGSHSILTVEASLNSQSEQQVSTTDATKILAANKKTSFLTSARVAFVI